MTPTLPTLYRVEALCRRTATRPDLLRRLEKVSLIERAGLGADKRPLFNEEAAVRVERVRELLNAGYPEKDVAVVLGLVTHRGETSGRVFVTPSELWPNPLVGVTPARRDEAVALLSPDAVRDDGEPLFAARRADRLRCILDLNHLGLNGLADAVTQAGAEGPLPEALAAEIRAALMARKHAVTRVMRALDRIDGAKPPRRWRRRTSRADA